MPRGQDVAACLGDAYDTYLGMYDDEAGMTTTITASELARNTSAALDAVGDGEHVEITRRGEVVAVLSPPRKPSGAEILGRHEGKVTIHCSEEELMSPIPAAHWTLG